MEVKLFDSELKVMEVLWKEGDLSAGQLAKILKDQTDWNRNTTYTVIKKLVEKNAIDRYEPNFMCKVIITREQVQQQETNELIGKYFNGSSEVFLSAFLNNKNLSQNEVDKLKKIVDDLK